MLPKLEAMLISENATIQQVLATIDKNAQGIVFVITPEQKISGVITDGDIRRAFLNGSTLQTFAQEIMQKDFVSRPVETPSEDIFKILDSKIRHIPLVDQKGRVVDYACVHKKHQIPIMEPYLNGNEQNYVMDCLKTKWISSQGKYVLQFENDFSKLSGGGHSVAVSNGTVALHLALETLKIGEGHEVIVPDLTFAASINSVLYTGALPVLVDVNKNDWCLNPVEIEKAITSRTKAIMPVHLYGQPCDMDAIMKIANKYNLFVIEDCAEAQGSHYHDKQVGLIGDVGCFSFFGNKMVTTGEGGMVIFKDSKYVERAKTLRDHGMSKERRYWHLEVGFNYRMTNIQAAIGVAQLEQFETILDKKLKVAAQYRKLLENVPGITLPPEIIQTRSIYWLFSVLLDEGYFGIRDQVIEKLLANGIQTRPIFYPLHQMEPYKKYADDRNFTVSNEIARTGISLPSSAELTSNDILRVCDALKQIAAVRKITGFNHVQGVAR